MKQGVFFNSKNSLPQPGKELKLKERKMNPSIVKVKLEFKARRETSSQARKSPETATSMEKDSSSYESRPRAKTLVGLQQ